MSFYLVSVLDLKICALNQSNRLIPHHSNVARTTLLKQLRRSLNNGQIALCNTKAFPNDSALPLYSWSKSMFETLLHYLHSRERSSRTIALSNIGEILKMGSTKIQKNIWLFHQRKKEVLFDIFKKNLFFGFQKGG